MSLGTSGLMLIVATGAAAAFRFFGAARFFAFFVRRVFAGQRFAAAALRLVLVLRPLLFADVFFVDFFFALRAIQSLLQSATRRKFRAWRQRAIYANVPNSCAFTRAEAMMLDL